MCGTRITKPNPLLQKKLISDSFHFKKWTCSVPIESPQTQRVRFDLLRGNSCVLLAGGPVKPMSPLTLAWRPWVSCSVSPNHRRSPSPIVSCKLWLGHYREIFPDVASVWGVNRGEDTWSSQTLLGGRAVLCAPLRAHNGVNPSVIEEERDTGSDSSRKICSRSKIWCIAVTLNDVQDNECRVSTC